MKLQFLIFFIIGAVNCLAMEMHPEQTAQTLQLSQQQEADRRERERRAIWGEAGIGLDQSGSPLAAIIADNQLRRSRLEQSVNLSENNIIPLQAVETPSDQSDTIGSYLKNFGIAGLSAAALYIIYRKAVRHK